MTKQPIFHNPGPLSRSEAERIFDSGRLQDTQEALVAVALHEADWRFVQDSCLRFLKSSEPGLRAVAATCLGHLARLHGTMELERVLPALRALLSDPACSGQAEDALGDIRMFMGVGPYSN